MRRDVDRLLSVGLLAAIALPLMAGLSHAQRSSDDPGAAAAPIVAGYLERMTLTKHRLTFEAKLDSGADTSSLNAEGIEQTRKSGRAMARFTLVDDTGRRAVVEAPVVRTARIRRAGTGPVERPVVVLDVCIAGVSGKAEFTLTDRSGMSAQVLIGRRFMARRILIDPSRRHLGSGRCGRPN